LDEEQSSKTAVGRIQRGVINAVNAFDHRESGIGRQSTRSMAELARAYARSPDVCDDTIINGTRSIAQFVLHQISFFLETVNHVDSMQGG